MKSVVLGLIAGTVLLSLNFLSANSAAAQEVFSWKDSWGRIHYGTKPPAGARDQQKLSGVVSRYSSDKLLKTRRNPSYSSSNTSPKSTARAAYKSDPAIDPAGDAKLEQTNFIFKQDAEQRVVACQTTLRNSGDGLADNLYVAFHFPDGSLIPAIGPQTIAANAEANFSLPQEMLPLTLERKAGEQSEAEKINSVPELIVHLTNGEFLGAAASNPSAAVPAAEAGEVASN